MGIAPAPLTGAPAIGAVLALNEEEIEPAAPTDWVSFVCSVESYLSNQHDMLCRAPAMPGNIVARNRDGIIPPAYRQKCDAIKAMAKGCTIKALSLKWFKVDVAPH